MIANYQAVIEMSGTLGHLSSLSQFNGLCDHFMQSNIQSLPRNSNNRQANQLKCNYI